MRGIVVAEICSMVMLGIVMLGVTTKEFVKDVRTKWFVATLVVFICMLFIDMASYMLNEGLLARIVNSLSYTAGSVVLIPFNYYVHAVINRTKPLSRWIVHALTIVVVAHCVYLFCQGMSGQLFSLDPSDYGSGEYSVVSELLIFACMSFSPLLVAIKGRHMGSRALGAVFMYLAMPLCTEIVGVMQDTAETYTLVAAAFSMLYMFVMLQENITQEILTEQKLAIMLARCDALTGIGNRYVGADAISERIQARRPFVMMVMDVDKFKSINDTYGHPVGDLVLKSVANVLKETFSDGGVPVRMGGDEFMVIIDGKSDTAGLSDIIQQLFTRVGAIKVEGMSPDHHVSLSVGVATYDGRSSYTFDDLYHVSDQRLYESKKHAGNYCTGV